jgi:glutaredoxin-like protein
MPLLNESDQQQVQEMFEGLSKPVTLAMFTQELECDFCAETRQLVEEVASLSENITAEIYNFVLDKEKVQEYQIDKIPAVAVIGDGVDYGIRFYGIPSGYEFNSLLEAIMNVSAQDSGLSDGTKDFLAGLKDPLHFQVFVTPT